MTDYDTIREALANLRGAIYALIGYVEALKPDDKITKEYAERLHEHYIPILRKWVESEALTRLSTPARGEPVAQKWYGYAGHFIGGRSCAYHLSTRVGGYLISTIGDYYTSSGERERLGAGDDSWFETMVFLCAGEEETGDPIITDWSSIDGERYAKSIDAERGHYRYIKKYEPKATTAPSAEAVERVARAIDETSQLESWSSQGVLTNLDEVAKAALAAMKGVGEWQPIETAPQDEDILLLSESDEIQAGRYDERYIRGSYNTEVECGWVFGGRFVSNKGYLTHWMPLPAAPRKGE